MAEIARKSVARSLADQVRFLRGLVAAPSKTGAIAPSGPGLARQMALPVDPADSLPVLELGPGTGVVTEAMLARGVAARHRVQGRGAGNVIGAH